MRLRPCIYAQAFVIFRPVCALCISKSNDGLHWFHPNTGQADPARKILVRNSHEVKGILQVEDRLIFECDEPPLFEHYDSWRHELDSYDRHAVENGHGMPINKTAHLQLAKDMRHAVLEPFRDPSALEHAVSSRRQLKEEMTSVVFSAAEGNQTRADGPEALARPSQRKTGQSIIIST